MILNEETFGQRLRRLRKKHGFTQAELAFQIGVHEITIRRWESGERPLENIKDIKKLVSVLQVSEDELLNGVPTEQQIGLRICRAEELKMHNVQATNEISLTTEFALISILDSKDYPDTPFEQDMEVSLVHELLHIPLKYISEPETGSLEYIHMEAFIERLARLLVAQVRSDIT